MKTDLNSFRLELGYGICTLVIIVGSFWAADKLVKSSEYVPVAFPTIFEVAGIIGSRE